MKRLLSTKVSENAFSLAMFILRVGAGASMMFGAGLGKLTNFSSGVAQFQDPLGIFPPTTGFALLVFAEFFCAAFVILGLFTRLAAIPIVIAMAVALFWTHKGLFFGEGSSAGLYLVCFLTIMIAGPGRLSLDRFVVK